MVLGALVLSTGSRAQTTDANQHTSYASQGHEAQRSKALQRAREETGKLEEAMAKTFGGNISATLSRCG